MTQRRIILRRGVASLLASALLVAPMATVVAIPAAAEEITPIAEIQGTGPATTLTETVTTRGVVTASYPTGGFNGFVIQTEGTGPHNKTVGASDAIFVYGSGTANQTIGAFVEVTGTPGEYNGLTQLSNPTVTVLDDVDFAAPLPIALSWPETDEAREAYESMLVQPAGDYTVSNTYSTNQYGEVGLAFGTKPLEQPTDLARPDTPEAKEVEADNARRAVTLDDGATTNFLNAANSGLTPPYVSVENPVRVGAAATFVDSVIVDYRNNTWKLNPTSATPAGEEIATFSNTRTTAPDSDKLGAATHTIAAFNVLNYFTTGGADVTGCTNYKDRAGNPITVNSCPDNGPRGAWDAENIKRQEDKIVAAINKVDASVIGLMEIENSAKLGETADEATATLVTKLNAAAGSDKWAYVPSSSDLPAVEQQDVITNAIIYKKSDVKPLGSSRALGNLSGSGQAFSNAREPLGQAFRPVGGGEPFFVVVNHFKSKGSGTGADADQGDGQGASNASRVAQATALAAWVPDALATVAAETETTISDVALVGDFNSYTEEDPLQVLYNAGYKNATKEHNAGEYSYSYQGLSGSLDHVLYSESFADRVTGSDIWEINSPESIALEYSRYNYHGTLFYAADEYRSSDHDPVILGILGGESDVTDINLININDFHGRIDENTVKFAGTIEKLRAEDKEDNTLFLSAGDNIGASLFASSVAQDKPTLDVLNALDLATSVVGNHEFDQGMDDLTGRVADASDFNYLGANVYHKGTENPALEEYHVIDVDGVSVGVIGAVTQETPTLVSPGGIASLDFGDPVAAVNRVAEQLTDGNTENGEADVIVALYHEGAGAGTPDGSSLAQEIAAGGAFAKIVTQTDENVSAIFTGHTHKQYAWLADNGDKAKRPVVQTGSYGENIGHITLTVDKNTKEVLNATATNVARVTTDDATLVSTYPRVQEVKTIVDAALAYAQVEGDKPVGSIAADITSAFTGGEYVDGKFTAGSDGARDNRAEASALGNLVADSLRETLAAEERGGADIGVVNPGGLRADLLKGEDGVITYAEANAVLPFVNNLWTTNLTGAQFKTMLEQQWQTNPDGSIPSRPYLQLGLSENVTYTYDESRALGDRITSITIDSQPIDPAATYTIGTFSFLAQGGDNFRVFNSATGTRDSGLIDRDAWVSYLQAHEDLEPSFARSGVSVTGFTGELATKAGATVELEVSRMDIRSLGAPANTELVATWTGGTLTGSIPAGTVTISGDSVTADLTAPEGAVGAGSLVLVANPSGTTITLPAKVEAADPPTPVETIVTLTAGKAVAGKKTPLTVTVTQDGAKLNGKVDIREGNKTIASGTATAGQAKIDVVLTEGKHTLIAVFTPTSGPSVNSTAVIVTVARAEQPEPPAGKTTVTLSAGKSVAGKKTTLTVTAKEGTTGLNGSVKIREGNKTIATGSVKNGQAKVDATFKVGTHRLVAVFTPTKGKETNSKELVVKTSKTTAKVATTLSKKTVTYPSKATIKVTVTGNGVRPTGKIEIRNGKKKIATATLKKASGNTATVTVKLPKLKPGKYTFSARYVGDSQVSAATSKNVKATVKKQKSTTKVAVSNGGRTIKVNVSAKERATGKVTLTVNGKTYTKKLSKGKATFTVQRPYYWGNYTYKVNYAGDKATAKSTGSKKYYVGR